ncbi:hypothetical protein GMES_0651 [Paraglaciecola mesophila KMM 241]|uniref:Uncharacterized protein n=1 Tax=Paraglaciecola mesophila KMM 241 TaxID=1128912 RepID=K6YG60_9ALTE|nr:hypothetical protein GMES_0651 [Paraglaciecola mesophila KMM 241]
MVDISIKACGVYLARSVQGAQLLVEKFLKAQCFEPSTCSPLEKERYLGK